MLITTPNLAAPDDVYQALIDAHRGLTEAESHRFNARLVLLLVNHIGDEAVLREALAAASGQAVPQSEPSLNRVGIPVQPAQQ